MACQIRSGVALMYTRWTCVVVARSAGTVSVVVMVALQLVLEVDERRDVALRVLVDPPVVDLADRHRVEEVELLPAVLAGHDQVGLLEDPQVLHHAVARHLQLRLELGQRPPVAGEQQVEQEPARRIGEGLEHPVVVRHASKIGDRKVTCQPRTASPAADGVGSGNRRMPSALPRPSRAARIGMPSATCSAIGRTSLLIATISACTCGGSSTRSSWSPASDSTSPSSSSAVATCCCSAGARTELDSARDVNSSDSVASMIAPAKARPNESPKEPAAELTPAASLTRSSEIGESV